MINFAHLTQDQSLSNATAIAIAVTVRSAMLKVCACQIPRVMIAAQKGRGQGVNVS